MRTLPTVITLIIALGLTIAAVLVPDRAGGSDARSADPGPPVLAPSVLDVNKVARIGLSRGGSQPVSMVFARDGGDWAQVEPFDYPMQTFSIRQLAVQAASLRSWSAIELTDNPDSTANEDALGLNPPRATLRLEQADGAPVVLELGRRGIAGRAYVRVAGENTVHIVNGDLHDRALDMNPKEWRQRTVFENVSVELDSVHWTYGTREGVHDITARRERRRWMLDARSSVYPDVTTRLGAELWENWLQQLAGTQVVGFIVDQPQDLSLFGLDRPAASITLTESEKVANDSGELIDTVTTQRLLVGSKVGENYNAMIEGRPVVFRLAESQIGLFVGDVRELADPIACGLNAADVRTIRIVSDAADFSLQRDGQKWRAVDHDNRIVNTAVVEQLLEHLTRTPASRIGFNAYPQDDHVANVILQTTAGRHDTVRIARRADQGWIMENGDNVWRVHSPDIVSLSLRPEDYGLPAD